MNSRTAFILFLGSVAAIWYGVIWIGQLAPIVLPPPHLVVMVMAKEWSELLYNTAVTLGTALIGYFSRQHHCDPISYLVSLSWLAAITRYSLGDRYKESADRFRGQPVDYYFWRLAHPSDSRRNTDLLSSIASQSDEGIRGGGSESFSRFQTLHATRWQRFRYVLWPNALPYYVAAHEIAFTSSIIAAVIAEFFFSRQGLGYLLIEAMNDHRGDRLWATNVIIALLSAAAYLVSRWLESVLIPWRRKRSKKARSRETEGMREVAATEIGANRAESEARAVPICTYHPSRR